jgi:hypothetical protein
MTAENWPVRVGIAAFYFFGMLANGLWFYAKFVLRSNGCPPSFIWHWGDLLQLRRLASAQSDPTRRFKYRALLFGIYASGALFFLLAFIFFFPYAGRHGSSPR